MHSFNRINSHSSVSIQSHSGMCYALERDRRHYLKKEKENSSEALGH